MSLIKRQLEKAIENGLVCPGCQADVDEKFGVECYCAAEGYSRAHEGYLWCGEECAARTHEIPYYAP